HVMLAQRGERNRTFDDLRVVAAVLEFVIDWKNSDELGIGLVATRRIDPRLQQPRRCCARVVAIERQPERSQYFGEISFISRPLLRPDPRTIANKREPCDVFLAPFHHVGLIRHATLDAQASSGPAKARGSSARRACVRQIGRRKRRETLTGTRRNWPIACEKIAYNEIGPRPIFRGRSRSAS